jgi:nitroreductase
MKFIELVQKRVSIRSYKPEPVSDELLNEILEAGRLAPSACNLQPFQFVVVRKKENLVALAAADSGLGTCWVGAFDPKVIRAALGVPRTVEPLILLTLGHPNESGRPKTRLPLDKLVRYETWK